MSKLLLHAKLSVKNISLRAASGDYDRQKILVSSNTKWHLETTASWITLNDTSVQTLDGIVQFSHSRNEDDTLLRARVGFIKIVAETGVVLNTVAVTQHANISGLRMTTDAAGTYIAPDDIISKSSGSTTFYVYNPDPQESWELVYANDPGNSWYSINTPTGSNTTLVTVSYNANSIIAPRRIIIDLKYTKNAAKTIPADTIEFIQPANVAADSIVNPLVGGGPGTWNADMEFTSVKFTLEDTSYSGVQDSSKPSLYDTRERNVRFSGNSNITRDHPYMILGEKEPSDVSATDSANNPSWFLGENYEKTQEEYDKWSNENAVWNLEAQGFGKEGVTDGSLLGYKGKENAFFSSDLVKNKLDDNKSTIFYTTAELNPSDMYENSSLTLRKNTKGVVEKATYTGDGVTTITLHNIYDPARGTDSQAFMIYDKYVKDKTSDTTPPFNGNINPLNHTIPIPSSSTSRGSFFMYTAGSGLIGTRLQNWFSFHNMAKDAVTIKVRATGIVPLVKKIELEGGGVYNEVTYGYEILSMGKYSDDGKTIPGDAVYTFNASGQRGFKFQDDESSMKLTAKFTDTVTITKIDGSTESVPAGGTYTWNWYSLMLASAKARKWATAIKITIIVAMSIALIIITWGGATYPVLAALYTISTLAMTANEVWQAVRAYKLRNSYLTSDMLGALSSLIGSSYVSTQALAHYYDADHIFLTVKRGHGSWHYWVSDYQATFEGSTIGIGERSSFHARWVELVEARERTQFVGGWDIKDSTGKFMSSPGEDFTGYAEMDYIGVEPVKVDLSQAFAVLALVTNTIKVVTLIQKFGEIKKRDNLPLIYTSGIGHALTYVTK